MCDQFSSVQPLSRVQLPPRQAAADPTSAGCTQALRGVSSSVSVGSSGAHKVFFGPLSMSGGYGV